MKKSILVCLSAVIVLTAFTACSKKAEYTAAEKTSSDNIATVSFNCAAPWGNYFQGTGSAFRVKRFAAYMNAVKPDSIGTQEMNSKWLGKLKTLMSDYDSYGVIRGGDKNEAQSEMNAIFWLKDKYTAVQQGTFWLSETPEKESRYEGAACYRICSWVLLENVATGERYYHFNTHLDHVSEEAADYGAKVIVSKAAEITEEYGEYPMVVTGDFNETAGMPAYDTIAEILFDPAAELAAEPQCTYQDWGSIAEGEPIDHIFISKGKECADYRILDDISGGYISDHYGVYIEWSI